MAKLKLKKLKSYYGGITGGTILATAKNPVVTVPDEDVNRLVSTGYFTEVNDDISKHMVGEVIREDTEPEYEREYAGEMLFDAENLAEMTVAELREFAKSKEIELDGLTKKAEILEAISAALGGSQNMMDIL